MGGSGSAWIKPKKRSGLRSHDLTNVPHPRFARAGQRYFPLHSTAKNVVTLRVLQVGPDTCKLTREDAERARRAVPTTRLLAAGDDGHGRYFRFVGYAPRMYATHGRVVEVDAAWTNIVCPEWHPGRPIAVANGAVPADLRKENAWLACRADLGARAAAHVSPSRFAAPAQGFDPEIYNDVTFTPERSDGDASSSDVVLFVSSTQLDAVVAGEPGVYLTGHPPPVRRGDRAYLHAGGRVRGWREVAGLRRLPNGVRVLLHGPWEPMDADARRPSSGVAGGEHGVQCWTLPDWSP